jgi:hypothetical protein
MPGFKLDLEVQDVRLRRGWILHVLNYFQLKQTREVSDQHIQAALRDGCKCPAEIPTIRADLRYLAERGYVEVTEPSDATFGMMSAYIRADGQDLLMGIKEDPGIDVGD